MAVPEIDVHELARLRDGGVSLLDVRTPGEYREARVSGGVLIPLGDLVERADDVVDDAGANAVYVICATGSRSARAAEYLRSLGVDAVNVAGGIVAWMDAGYPVDAGDEV